MSNLTHFNSFKTSYRKLVQQARNDLTRINIQLFHHDFQGEPFLLVEANIENVRLESVEEHGQIISILTNETTFPFSEKNYHTNLSDDAVAFSSKHNNETYCIIEFI